MIKRWVIHGVSVTKVWTLGTMILVIWLWLYAITPVMHRAVFTVVPPDGAVSTEVRGQIDTRVSRYLLSGDATNLDPLTEREIRHMVDVRLILLLLLPKIIINLATLGALNVSRKIVDATLIFVGGAALVTLIIFQPFFLWIHTIIFTNVDWVLPSATYLLTQIYPTGFFFTSWALLLALTILTLIVIRVLLPAKPGKSILDKVQ